MSGQWLRAERLLRRGQRLAALGQFDAASATFTQARQLRPQSVGLALHHALTLSELGQLAEAVHTLEQAMVLQPAHPILPLFLGRIYSDHGDYAQAMRWCHRALALQPVNPQGLALQALLDLATGEVSRACTRLLQPPLEAVPASARLCLWLARRPVPPLVQRANTAMQGRLLVHTEQALQQYPQAQTLAQQVLATSPPQVPENLADRLMLAVDHGLDWGILQIRRLYALLRYATQPAARGLHLLRLRAERAAHRGQAALAQTLYTTLARQSPELPGLDERMCEAYYGQGKFREALQHLQRLRQTLPEPDQPDTVMALWLGELLCETGRPAEAAPFLNRPPVGPMRDYRWAYYQGLCALYAGDLLAARRAYVRAVQQIHPDLVALRLQELARLAGMSWPG